MWDLLYKEKKRQNERNKMDHSPHFASMIHMNDVILDILLYKVVHKYSFI